MKRIFTFILLSIFAAAAFAQVPQKLSYQAVIRNTSDQLVTNTTVGMQISILQGSATGTVVYSETQTPTTNANGLVSIEIGGGTGFDAIDWSNGPYFIKTETDITGGTTYTISGTSELLSVPYALHAKTAESVVGGITETDPVFDLSAAATISATDITNWDNKLSAEVDGDVTNELQILSISNDTIRLTNGGFVKLPAGFDGDYNSLINKPTIPVVPTNVGAFTNDVGYLTSFTEIDGDATNELQILSISNDTIRLTNGGYVKLPAGFDGDYNSLINKPTIPVVPTNVGAFTNDAGYLTSFTEIDGDATNELQILSISNDTIRLTNGGYVKLPAGFDGQYSSLTGAPTNVSAFTNDAGYLTTFTEVDGSVTNEIQVLSISNDTIYLSNGGYVKIPPSNAWTLSGNAGTVDGINFIGTTDNVPLGFMVHGQKSGKIDASSGTFLGYQSGMNNASAENTAFGYQTLKSNSSTPDNTAIGYKALTNNIGSGGRNTAVGAHAMVWNTSGEWNTAMGAGVMEDNITGSGNTAIGGIVLRSNQTGENNAAFGYAAMVDNVSGSWNTSLGFYSLEKASTGYYNTAVGGWAGRNNANGSYNVFLGYKAGYNETGSNKLYIANSEVNPPLIYGDFSTGAVGIGTTDPTSALSSVTKLLINGGMVVIPQGGSDRVAISPMSSPNAGYASFLTITPSDVPFNTGEALAKVQIQNASSSIPAMWIVNQGTGDLLGMGNSNSYGNSSFVVKNNGDVGIGTTAPSCKLDVAADAQINGVRIGRGNGNIITNTAVGLGTLNNNTTGNWNAAFGEQALNSNTTGFSNTAFGRFALKNTSTGTQNTAVGQSSLYRNTSGSENTAVGGGSLLNNTDGHHNTSIGTSSMYNNSSGSYNVSMGYESGFQATGSNNIFIGHAAGYNETGSNKLYISNSNTSTPLIYGDFSTATLTIYSNLNINNAFTFPNADGTSGQVLSTNGAGVLGWNSLATVATSGSYNDLSDKPLLFDGQYSSLTGAPTNVSAFTNDAGYLTSFTEVDPEVGANTTNYVPKWDGSALVSSTIYDNGNIGIGTTSPSVKLDVRGNVKIGASNTINIWDWDGVEKIGIDYNTVNGDFNMRNPVDGKRLLGTISSTGSYGIEIANVGTEVFRVCGNGNVGIGTTTPGARLQIKPTADDLSLRIMSPASDARYISIYRGGNAGVINVAGNAISNEPYLSLQVGGSEKMSIYNTGNVGIGTTIASTKLEVVGVITATGGNSTNWNTAYSWGDHAGLYRPVSWVPDWTDVTNKPSFALVATSGSYSDLSNTPTNVSSFINDAGYLTSFTEVDGDVTNEIEMPDDANAGDMAYFDGSAWVKIPKGNDNQILTLQAGIPTWQNQFALPTATSTVATNVTATTATLNGIVNANGLSTVVTFEYGPTTSYGTTVTAIQSPVTGAASTSVSVDISGLVDGTTYYFRIKAENAIGIVYSTEMSFQFLSVGESYQGGIVAYILQAGDPGYDASIQHGIIAAPSDQSTNAQWGCINTLLCSEITTEGMPIGKGNQNTMEIINGCSTSGIAARLCGDLVLGGYDDWYLPSYNELMQVYLNRVVIGGLSGSEYWSSSEGTAWYAYTIRFSDGTFQYPNKNYLYSVRAIRSF